MHLIFVMALGLALVFCVLKFVKRFNWEGPESVLNQMAIVAGAFSFMTFFAFLQEFNASPRDSPRGMALAGLATIMGLIILSGRVKKESVLGRCVHVSYLLQ